MLRDVPTHDRSREFRSLLFRRKVKLNVVLELRRRVVQFAHILVCEDCTQLLVRPLQRNAIEAVEVAITPFRMSARAATSRAMRRQGEAFSRLITRKRSWARSNSAA